ncbi:MAG: hypothetical protein FE834_04570 [Gammaproteobacteria bacterium]|nr:hypothetical protein [Gammaproteobacteria bacterium]
MTLKARIIVRFKGLKKSRIAISILDFLSPLKQTIIRTFLVSLVFINGIIIKIPSFIKNFLKILLALLRVDLKNSKINKICHPVNHSYLCKSLI